MSLSMLSGDEYSQLPKVSNAVTILKFAFKKVIGIEAKLKSIGQKASHCMISLSLSF